MLLYSNVCSNATLRLIFFYLFLVPNGNIFLAAPRAACGILVCQQGIKPRPPAVEVQSPNHHTARNSLIFILFSFGLHWVGLSFLEKVVGREGRGLCSGYRPPQPASEMPLRRV